MTMNLSRQMIAYGIFLMVMGGIGYLSNPEKAGTALVSGGTFGGVSVVWGILMGRGVRWSHWAALVTVSLLCVVFVWRASASWSAYFGGAAGKWIAASLITAMAAASISLLIRFCVAIASSRPGPGASRQ